MYLYDILLLALGALFFVGIVLSILVRIFHKGR
jgi:hypothetical protein